MQSASFQEVNFINRNLQKIPIHHKNRNVIRNKTQESVLKKLCETKTTVCIKNLIELSGKSQNVSKTAPQTSDWFLDAHGVLPKNQ